MLQMFIQIIIPPLSNAEQLTLHFCAKRDFVMQLADNYRQKKVKKLFFVRNFMPWAFRNRPVAAHKSLHWNRPKSGVTYTLRVETPSSRKENSSAKAKCRINFSERTGLRCIVMQLQAGATAKSLKLRLQSWKNVCRKILTSKVKAAGEVLICFRVLYGGSFSGSHGVDYRVIESGIGRALYIRRAALRDRPERNLARYWTRLLLCCLNSCRSPIHFTTLVSLRLWKSSAYLASGTGAMRLQQDIVHFWSRLQERRLLWRGYSQPLLARDSGIFKSMTNSCGLS